MQTEGVGSAQQSLMVKMMPFEGSCGARYMDEKKVGSVGRTRCCEWVSGKMTGLMLVTLARVSTVKDRTAQPWGAYLLSEREQSQVVAGKWGNHKLKERWVILGY